MPDIDDAQPYPQGRSAYPSTFGRGWIPEERDIGLPGEGLAPLPLAGGVGGGHDPGAAPGAWPTPDPSREREGDRVAPVRADQFTPVRQVRFLDALASAGSVRKACGSG